MISVKHELRVGGRRVSERRFIEQIKREAIKEAETELVRNLRRLRDSVTGERLNVRATGGKIHIEGPEALVKKANKLLSSK